MTLPLTDVVSIEPDLQQPLLAAQILVNVMPNPLDDDPTSLGVLEFLDRSLAASRGMLSGLGGAIFDSSRVQSTSATVDIGQILREVFEECRPFAAHKGLKFRVFTPPGLRTHSDPLMLRRIVQNLVSNAIKFTASGGVLIGARRREGALHLQVWDTGPGIAPVLEERIFDQFYQTDRQHDRPNGSGLGIGGIGLANVRQMAALLDHRIGLRSRLGRGSVFTVVVADVPDTIARAVA